MLLQISPSLPEKHGRPVDGVEVGAGGFLGLAKHDVVVSVSKFKLVDGKLVLPGVEGSFEGKPGVRIRQVAWLSYFTGIEICHSSIATASVAVSGAGHALQ